MTARVEHAALARVGGLPVRLWLAAANSTLAGQIHDLEERVRAHHARTASLAELVGTELVPHLSLSAGERALALKVRRALHNGAPVSDADSAALVDTARRVGAPDELVGGLLDAAAHQAELAAAEQAAGQSLATEQDRLLHGSWELVNGSAAASRALRRNNPTTYHDIARRIDRGEKWTGKRLRRGSEYLWRMIERGTTKPTPRGWFGHIGLVAVDDREQWTDPDLILGPDITSYTMENVYLHRHRLGSDPTLWSDPSARVSLTPLRRVGDGYLWVWADHPDPSRQPNQPGRVVEIKLRRTPAVDALVSTLGERAHPVGVAVNCLLPVAGTTARALAFLRHLATMGVLTVTSPPTPQRVRGRYATVSAVDTAVGVAVDENGQPIRDGDRQFLDVHREVRSTLPAGWYRRIEELAARVGRVGALLSADRQIRPDNATLTTRPQPLLDLVYDQLRTMPEQVDKTPHQHGWPRPAHPDSAYAALFDSLTRAPATGSVDITADLLDRLGAPAARFDWPVDMLVRPIHVATGPLAVLGHAAPAGVLDARFADMLAMSRGRIPQVAAYRELLRQIEDDTGGLFVEVLLPPVSAIAANAVRRPVYTRAWTGDPDPRPYHDEAPPADYRYIPLSDITLRECDGAVVAEADGRWIWPVYHATRTPRKPWEMLHQSLMGASPQPWYWPVCLSGHRDLFTNRDSMPRITIDNSLVLTPAAWRVDPTGLWDVDAPALTRARGLDRLRHRLGLPRWVFVDGAPAGKLACDLDSARAVGVIERVVDESPDGTVTFEEMLPDPDHFLAADDQPTPDRFATELLLRFPFAESPAELAARVAPELASRVSRATRPLAVSRQRVVRR